MGPTARPHSPGPPSGADPSTDPLRVCDDGCLFLRRHRFCAWHGTRLRSIIGIQLGRFRVERAINADGGFGAVYYARNVHQPEVEAAVKILKPPYCYNPEMVEIFLREAGLGRGLAVTQIPKIFDVGREPWPHITMEYVDGRSLREEELRLAAESRVIDGNTARGILQGLATALQACHDRGLIHRDIKPQNVLLTRDRSGPPASWVRVIDWGIGLKLDRAQKSQDASSAEPRFADTLSRMGSPVYMAPEHFDGRIDKRSDIYQFGLVAFELLTGESPFASRPAAGDVAHWQNVHTFQSPREARKVRSDIPADVSRVITRCLEKRPENRFRDGRELFEALSVRPVSSRLKWAVAALLLLSVGLLFWRSTRETRPLLIFWGNSMDELLPWDVDPTATRREGEEIPRVFWSRGTAELRSLGELRIAAHRASNLRLSRVAATGERALTTALRTEAGATIVDFRAIADDLDHDAGVAAGRVDFVATGTMADESGSTPFAQRFAIQLDDAPPELQVTLTLDDGTRAVLDVAEAPDVATPKAREETAIWMSRGGGAVDILIDVDDANLSVPESYHGRRGDEAPGVEVAWGASPGRIEAIECEPIDAGRFRARVDIPALDPIMGTPRWLEVHVRDASQNVTTLRRALRFDSDLEVALADDGRLERLPADRARVTLTWREPYRLAEEHIAATLAIRDDDARAVRVERVALDGTRAAVVLDLADVLDSLESGSTRPLDLQVSLPFANAANQPRSARVGPIEVGSRSAFDLELLRDGIVAIWDDRARAPLALELLAYPANDDPRRFVLESPIGPSALRLHQEDRSRFAIDWGSVVVEGAPASDRRAPGERSPDDQPIDHEIALAPWTEDGTRELVLTVQDPWDRSPRRIPVSIRVAKSIPEFPEVIRRGTSSDLRLAPGIAHTSQPDAEYRVAWSPLYRSLFVSVATITGSELLRDHFELSPGSDGRWATFQIVDRERQPLREGVYRMAFELEDIFGNRSRGEDSSVTIVHLGDRPRIVSDCPEGEECATRAATGRSSCEFVARISDASGVAEIGIGIDGESLSKVVVANLDRSDVRRSLEARGLRIEGVERAPGSEFITELTLRRTGPRIGSSETLQISASDQADALHRLTQRMFRLRCEVSTLPDCVRYLGLEWRKVERESRVFYVSPVEVCRGFWRDPRFFESRDRSEEDRLPMTSLEPEEAWRWALEHGFDLPTRDEWTSVASGLEGRQAWARDDRVLTDGADPRTRDLLAAVHLRTEGNIGPVAVDARPERWDELFERYPGLHHGALHVLGNVAELVTDATSPDATPRFLYVGGSFFHPSLERAVEPRGASSLSYVGFRVVVRPTDWIDAAGIARRPPAGFLEAIDAAIEAPCAGE